VVERLKKDFGEKVLCCDFKLLPFPDLYFDFCIDRSSIQHNTREDIALIHKEVLRVLKPGGLFFSSSIKSGLVKSGDIEFVTTYLSEEELRNSLSEFSHFDLDYMKITRDNGKEDFTHYLITAVK
jgi:ubiquinone/menaquinone biosynthesis C-methylase UbiE